MEVFYYNGSETIRLTNDSIPDYSVSLLNNELYWISGDSIACISNGNVETRCTIVSELNSNVTRIKALKNSGGKKAIVWQQECDSDVNFYVFTTQEDKADVLAFLESVGYWGK